MKPIFTRAKQRTKQYRLLWRWGWKRITAVQVVVDEGLAKPISWSVVQYCQ